MNKCTLQINLLQFSRQLSQLKKRACDFLNIFFFWRNAHCNVSTEEHSRVAWQAELEKKKKKQKRPHPDDFMFRTR